MKTASRDNPAGHIHQEYLSIDARESGTHGKIGVIMVEMTDNPRMRRPETGDDAYTAVAGGFVRAAGGVAQMEMIGPERNWLRGVGRWGSQTETT